MVLRLLSFTSKAIHSVAKFRRAFRTLFLLEAFHRMDYKRGILEDGLFTIFFCVDMGFCWKDFLVDRLMSGVSFL